MLHVIEVLAAGGLGGTLGWFVGLAACPNWGDLGMGAITWAVGGAVIGAAGGVAAMTAVIG